MLLAHIQFHRKGFGKGFGWNFILRSSFPLLIRWIKGEVKGFDVDALTADSISVEEAARLHDEGFSLVPDDMVVEVGPVRRQIKILKIERS